MEALNGLVLLCPADQMDPSPFGWRACQAPQASLGRCAREDGGQGRSEPGWATGFWQPASALQEARTWGCHEGHGRPNSF
jgi:hypothetical protein